MYHKIKYIFLCIDNIYNNLPQVHIIYVQNIMCQSFIHTHHTHTLYLMNYCSISASILTLTLSGGRTLTIQYWST